MEDKSLLSQLSRTGFLGALPSDRLAQVIDGSTVRSLSANEALVQEGDPGASMFVVLEGHLLVSKQGIWIAEASEGHHLGEMALIEGRGRSASISAMEPSRVLEIPEALFRTHVLSSPESLLALLRTFSARMRNDLHSLASDNQQITEYAAEVERVNRELSSIKSSLEEKNRQLEHISSIDTLTGLANRRHFDETLRQEWRRASRDGSPLSVAYCDIDFFKAFNDAYGHLAGDDCLRRVARSLGESVSRPADLAARYGGEEFVLLLVDTTSEGASFLAQRMRSRVEDLRIPHPRSPIARVVTVSLGIATMVPLAGSRPEDLVGRADAALYRAKEGGRNRVSLSEDDVGDSPTSSVTSSERA